MIEETAITLGGTTAAFLSSEKLLHGMLVHFLQFLLRREILAEIGDEFGANSGARHTHHPQRAKEQALSHRHGFAWLHIACGFRRKLIHCHAAGATGIAGQAATLVNADGTITKVAAEVMPTINELMQSPMLKMLGVGKKGK